MTKFNSDLLLAIQNEKLDEVRRIIEENKDNKDFDINARNESGETCIYWAANTDDGDIGYEIFKELVWAGGNLLIKDNLEESVRSQVIFNSKIEKDINKFKEIWNDGNPDLKKLANEGNYMVLLLCFNAGAVSFNSRLMHCAVLNCPADKRQDTLRAIIKYSDDMYERNMDGRTAADLAAMKGDLDSLKLLIAGGHKPERDAGSLHMSLLHYAVKEDKAHIIKELAEVYKVNVNKLVALDNKKYTPLECAIKLWNAPNAAKALVELGADVNLSGDGVVGNNPIFDAVKRGDDALLSDVLLKSPLVDLSIKDTDDKTALHHAVNSLSLTQLLVAKGADISAKDKFGKTPFDYTAKANIMLTMIANGYGAFKYGETERRAVTSLANKGLLQLNGVTDDGNVKYNFPNSVKIGVASIAIALFGMASAVINYSLNSQEQQGHER